MNELELGAGINPGMVFNPFPFSIWIRRDLNPQPLDCESSSLTTRPDLRPNRMQPLRHYKNNINQSVLSNHVALPPRPLVYYFREN